MEAATGPVQRREQLHRRRWVAIGEAEGDAWEAGQRFPWTRDTGVSQVVVGLPVVLVIVRDEARVDRAVSQHPCQQLGAASVAGAVVIAPVIVQQRLDAALVAGRRQQPFRLDGVEAIEAGVGTELGLVLWVDPIALPAGSDRAVVTYVQLESRGRKLLAAGPQVDQRFAVDEERNGLPHSLVSPAELVVTERNG